MPTVSQETVDTFLKDLRDSGRINMMGAAPYVAKAFGLTATEARKMTVAWMESFKDTRIGE